MTKEETVAHNRRSLIYLRGWAKGAGKTEFAKALQWAPKYHELHRRKDGTPYEGHLIQVAGYLQALGFDDDCMLAGAMLHDSIEDKLVTGEDLLRAKFAVPVIMHVQRMDKTSLTTEVYYEILGDFPETGLVKLADRVHNISTLAGVFSKDKAKEYIKETEEFVLPLLREIRRQRPEWEDKLFVIKFDLEAMMNILRVAYKIK